MSICLCCLAAATDAAAAAARIYIVTGLYCQLWQRTNERTSERTKNGKGKQKGKRNNRPRLVAAFISRVISSEMEGLEVPPGFTIDVETSRSRDQTCHPRYPRHPRHPRHPCHPNPAKPPVGPSCSSIDGSLSLSLFFRFFLICLVLVISFALAHTQHIAYRLALYQLSAYFPH